MQYDETTISTIPAPPRANIEFLGELCWQCKYRGVAGMCGKYSVCLMFRDVHNDFYALNDNADHCLLRCKACLDYEQALAKFPTPQLIKEFVKR